MAEREHSFSLIAIFDRFAKRLAHNPSMAGKSLEQVQTEARRRAWNILIGKPEVVKPDRINRELEQAKNWRKKATGNDAKAFEESQKDSKAHRYVTRTPDDAKQLFVDAKLLTTARGESVPDWITKAGTLNTPQALEFVSIISTLPVELQKDQYFLYREASRLYWSTNWTELPNEAVVEIRGLIDKTFEHIRFLDASNPDFVYPDDTLMLGYDRRPDIYRTKRLEDLHKDIANAPPPKKLKGKVDENDAGFNAWKEKRIKVLQRQKLEDALINFQKNLDRPSVTNPKTQMELMDEFWKELMHGQGDKNYEFNDIEFGLKHRAIRYNAEADVYIDTVRITRDNIENTMMAEREMEMKRQRTGRNILLTPLRRLEAGSTMPPEIQRLWNNIVQDDTLFNLSSETDIITRISELHTASSSATLTTEQQNIANGLQEQLRHRLDQIFRGEIPQPNRLLYPREKLLKLIKDPLGFMQSELSGLQQIFLDEGPDSERYRQAEEQFQQLQQIFGSESLFATLEAGLPENLTADERAQFYSPENRKAMEGVQKVILTENRDVLNHLKLLYMISSSQNLEKDSERIVQYANAIGIGGVIRSRKRYNGIMDQVIRQYIDPVHASEILDTSKGTLNRHITRETYDRVRRKVKKMLERDANIFQGQYGEWYKDMTGDQLKVFMEPKDVEGKDQFSNNIDSIVDEAMMYYRVQLTEGMNHMRRGLTGIEGYIYDKWRFGHNFVRSWEDDLRKPSQHFSEGYQKYFADNEVNITIAWHRIDGFASTRPEIAAAAKKQAERDWVMIEGLKNRVRLGHKLEIIDKNDPDYNNIKKFEVVYRVFPKRAKKVDGESINNFIAHVSKKDYEKQLAIHIAFPLFEAAVDGSYKLQDSGWRQFQVILKIFSEHEKWGGDYVDKNHKNFLFDEMLGRELARDWFAPKGEEAEGPGMKERNKYLSNLARRIAHAPHAYASIDSVVDGVAQFNDPLYKWNKLDEISMRFHQIEAVRERTLGENGKGIVHIDYFIGPTAEQRAIIDNIFSQIPPTGDFTLTVDQYLEIQKEFASKYLEGIDLNKLPEKPDDDGGGDKIYKFASMRFGRHMIHTIVNDVPWLDMNPETTSVELRGGGDSGDPYGRYVKDNYGGAVAAASALQGTYTLERKALYENLAKYRQIVKSINAEAIVDATRSLILMSEAMTIEQLDVVQGIFKNDWEISYEQKVLGSNASTARNPIEMEHFMDEFAQDGNPALNSPLYWKAAERKLKVTDWEHALGGHHGKLAKLLDSADTYYKEEVESKLPEGLQRYFAKIIGNKTFHRVTHFLDKNIPEYVVLFRGKNVVMYFFLLTGLYIGKEAQQKRGDDHSS